MFCRSAVFRIDRKECCLNYILLSLRFSEREINIPLTLCELAARAPDISASHMINQATGCVPSPAEAVSQKSNGTYL